MCIDILFRLFKSKIVIEPAVAPCTPGIPSIPSAPNVTTVEHKISIKDVINVLPWHPTKRWGNRALNVVNKVIIHQTLSGGTMESVNRYHITPAADNHISAAGAPHICYHYVIEKNGVIYQTNKLTHTTWHCTGQNTHSIGILVMGNFAAPNYIGTDKPTEKQIQSLKELLDAITGRNLGLTIQKSNIFGHCDFGKSACPGTRLYSFIQEYKQS